MEGEDEVENEGERTGGATGKGAEWRFGNGYVGEWRCWNG